MNEEIYKSHFDGYLWLSDQTEPVLVLRNEEFAMSIQGEDVEILTGQVELALGQFIVEAMLFDRDRNISYSIKYIDGKYQVAEFIVDPLDFNRDNVQIVSYMGSRKCLGSLLFLKYWKEMPDKMCEGMAVLQPQAFVFVGFVNMED